MLRLIASNNENRDNIESKIAEFKQIKHEIDVLNAKCDVLKKELIESYFEQNDTFVGSEGLVIATYKTQNRNSFDSTKFKNDFPDIYKEYQKLSEIKVFLIK